jgi:NAD(P)-dependent dehydrogenase (short-subunit alcohol dehydrogenase family)
MTGRLESRVALVFGAGSSGPGWGNGKAAAALYAREGARVVAVDRVRGAAEETAAIIV